MLKKCYFEPCLLQVLSTFCVLISIINPICTLRSLLFYWSHFVANFLVLQAIYAKIVKSIQAQRIRVKLSIADQRLKGKKRSKCQEIGAAGNLVGCEIASYLSLFMAHATVPSCCSFDLLTVVPFLVFFPFYPL